MQNELIDFTNCSKITSHVEGNSQKVRIIYNNEIYIMKYGDELSEKINLPKQSRYNHSPITEYVGCQVMKALGIPVQDVLLGICGDQEVVACKDFIRNSKINNLIFIPFQSLEREVIKSSERGKAPKLANINTIIDTHPFFEGAREQAHNRYWDTFIGDSIIANYDRHTGNWGYFAKVSPKDNVSTVFVSNTPVYDCGSSLGAWMAEMEMPGIVNDPVELKNRAFGYPRACLINKGNKRIGYHDMLLCEEGKRGREALIRLAPAIKKLNINDIIDDVPGISNVRKDFYKATIYTRIENILQPAYDLACKENGLGNNSIIPRSPTITREGKNTITKSGLIFEGKRTLLNEIKSGFER